jgi:parallel beta helix pectate lyase-like protein
MPTGSVTLVGHRLGMGLLVAVVIALGAGASAQAATIAVTNGNDSGPGSLRAAVAAAIPGEMITVPASTVFLTSGQIVVSKSLTIIGAGARETTISGTGQSRVFDVTNGTASISGVTVTGGDGFDTPGGTPGPGGGMLVDGGTLTLADSTVTGNQTMGFSEGSGIQADSSLTVLRSTISFNSGPGSNRAGGIGFEGGGTLQVVDSTLAHNTLESGGLGAAVYVNSAATVAFTNDTLDLDSAGATGSVLDLNVGSFPAMIANTIVAGGSSESCSRMPATSPSQGGNIDDQNLCEFTASTDHPSTDPQLGALQNNGGPTDTQLPPVASPPIDAGADAPCPATDQRGAPRPQGPNCDSGAVERTKPTAGSPTVSNITATGASVTATANPLFLGGTYVYNYGTTTAYGHSTAAAQLEPGVGAQPAPATLAGLTPATAYHLQLVVTTPDGTAASSDVAFTTQSAQSAPPPAKPAISSLRVSPKRLSVAGRRVNGRCVKPTSKNRGNEHCKRPSTLRISYTLNVTTTVTVALERQAAGRKVNGRCVKPTKKNHKHGECTRLVNVPGKLTFAGQAGANRSTFNGKIGGHQLGPGAYQLIATPAGGSSSTVTFKIAP